MRRLAFFAILSDSEKNSVEVIIELMVNKIVVEALFYTFF